MEDQLPLTTPPAPGRDFRVPITDEDLRASIQRQFALEEALDLIEKHPLFDKGLAGMRVAADAITAKLARVTLTNTTLALKAAARAGGDITGATQILYEGSFALILRSIEEGPADARG